MSGEESVDEPVDVLLIGLGACGAVAAHVLTAAGLHVTALEAGPRRDPGQMRSDEIHNDIDGWLSWPKAIDEVPTLRMDECADASPTWWPTLMVNAVGGTAIHYPGASFRLSPWNFRSRSATIQRYGETAIPEDSTLADWPLDYDELEPYYERVEHAIGVSGADELAPFAGRRARGYPMPPLQRSGWNELTDAAARRLGWQPYPTPAALNSREYQDRPACTYCGHCSGNGCYRRAKGSPDVHLIPAAEATGRLRIVTGARATSIEVDPAHSSRISGVRYRHEGRERFAPALVVLLAAFTYENSRLLLLSRSARFPDGIGNHHGQVGAHFVPHVTPSMYGLFPGQRLNLHTGTWAQGTVVDDWNGDNFDHTGLGFLGGGALIAANEVRPIAASGQTPPDVPRWGSSWKAWLAQHAQSVGSAVAQFESLTYDGNRLDLDPVARDASGMPRVRITYRPRENERRGVAFLRTKLETWLRAAGATETWPNEAVHIEGRHVYGGTRMGEDPRDSVLDRFGFAHAAPNLGVLGGSTFVTSGGHNPTLTAQALAWRTADELVRRWSALAIH
ncbi:MAG TPA: GMC family oxidoreductase [Microbacteriaceae bacterium]|nr:GMC family oxidoreductase [Microbacteriaceae bacterium]